MTTSGVRWGYALLVCFAKALSAFLFLWAALDELHHFADRLLRPRGVLRVVLEEVVLESAPEEDPVKVVKFLRAHSEP